MTLAASITLGITIAGFLGGIFWKVAQMSKDNGKLTEKVNSMENRAREDRETNSRNFSELFSRTNAAEQNITALNGKVDNLTNICSKMDSKLDKIIEAGNGAR